MVVTMLTNRVKTKKNKGQTLVEMALILPILVLLTFGLVDFGRLFHVYLVATEASREGARAAAVGSTVTGVKAAVDKIAGQTSLTNKPTVTTNPTTLPPSNHGSSIQVTVAYKVTMLTPLIGEFVNDSGKDYHTVSCSSTMRYE